MDAFVGIRVFLFMPAWSKGMYVRFSLFWNVTLRNILEERIYRAAETWKHANSKCILLFDSACLRACSSLFGFFLGGEGLTLFICLLSYRLQFYSFLKLLCVNLATFLLFEKKLISRNILLLFVLCLLLSCFVEITCVMLETGCESDLYNSYICIIPTVCANSWYIFKLYYHKIRSVCRLELQLFSTGSAIQALW
jgi:hypothetical protein